jgi:hypothetical protein
MTFQQWLETQTDFEESIFYDANGEEIDMAEEIEIR